MSIALKKRPPEGVPTPTSMHVAFFVDMAGNPSLKDSNGVVTPATNAGGPVQLNEQEEAPPVVSNAVKLYSKDVNGNAELFTLNGAGTEVQITAGNGVSSNTRIRWKDDVPGNLFDATNMTPTLADVVAIFTDPATTLSGLGVKEGSTINAGDRVLRACALTQTENQINNGIWVAAAGAWTRATDANTGAEIQDAIVEFVSDPGPPATAFRFALWNPSGVPLTVGTDPQNWVIVVNSTPFPGVVEAEVVATSNIALTGDGQTIDGVAIAFGVVLAVGQNNPLQNGLYEVQPGAWTRLEPYVEGYPLAGVFTVKINQGDLYTNRVFNLNNPIYRAAIVGVDPLNFVLLDTANLASFGPLRSDAEFNDAFMARSVSPGVPCWGLFVITLPAITPESAGKRITFVNYGGKNKSKAGMQGMFIAQPAGTDIVGDGGPGEAQAVVALGASTELMSDGFGRWAPMGGINFTTPLLEGEIVPTPPAP